MSNHDCIDAVIIWVDGADPDWQKERAQYSPQKNTDSRTERYRDMGLLKYWFRGIEKFAPWIRKIHFVTNGQVPSWLNLNADKLHFVKHEDYIPHDFLPTFSANPIELNIHRIEGLSEQFLYFNDDEFLISPTESDLFFQNGLPRQFVSFLPLYYDSTDNVFSNILKNNLTVINRNFSKSDYQRNIVKYISKNNGNIKTRLRNLKYVFFGIPGIEYSHLMAPYLKSTFTDVWNAEENCLINTSSHKFRSAEDVNQFLMQYWQISSGKFHPTSEDSIGKYFYLPNSYMEAASCIKSQKYKTICLNDGAFASKEEYNQCKMELTLAFETILNQKSSFEL
ncbi:MAG: Stealth CR1 domain-containing protein [Oscillospiraceae bacterium]|nr:Stealth CR1 domain-containing protein [Oscillospiraceae bacterium]MDD6145889.1 Stealth CR1 domain-containing protein [Oscillospiraceae bacterium]